MIFNKGDLVRDEAGYVCMVIKQTYQTYNPKYDVYLVYRSETGERVKRTLQQLTRLKNNEV